MAVGTLITGLGVVVAAGAGGWVGWGGTVVFFAPCPWVGTAVTTGGVLATAVMVPS